MISAVSRLRPFLLAVLASAGLFACDGGDTSSPGESVDSNVEIRLTSGTGMRGLTVTLGHSSNVSVVSVMALDAPLATASCQTNPTDTELIATCASTTTFSAPIDAFRVTLRHFSSYDALDELTGLDCEASDAGGATFAVACIAVLVP